jgi:putative tryptophan/tyrosine transport system substrate-binding protein
MNRRETVLALFALGATPFASEAQKPTKVRRIGFLAVRRRPSPGSPDPFYSAFVHGLEELGYYEGKNLTIEWRYADGKFERLPGLAAELVKLNLEVIVTSSTPPTVALQKATRSIPIVAIAVTDPVGQGLTVSLSRPGGNVTGLANLFDDVAPKQFELLKEIVPTISRAGVLLNKGNPSYASVLDKYLAAARQVGVTPILFDARTAEGIESAFAAMPRERVEALIVVADSFLAGQREQIAALELKHKLPSMAPFVEDALAGTLLSYGPNIAEVFRHGATYVDKILKGARAADLPFEQPTTFELAINMNTAKLLGIKIPQSVLLRADRAIE